MRGADFGLARSTDVPRLLGALQIERSIYATARLADATGSANEAGTALGVLLALGLGKIGWLARIISVGLPHAKQGEQTCSRPAGSGPEQATTR